MSLEQAAGAVRAAAERVFGEHLEQAARYVELLELHGVERGLIGPGRSTGCGSGTSSTRR